jgi:hypothetical protein
MPGARGGVDSGRLHPGVAEGPPVVAQRVIEYVQP